MRNVTHIRVYNADKKLFTRIARRKKMTSADAFRALLRRKKR